MKMLPLTAAGTNADQVFGTILLILIAVLVALVIAALRAKNKAAATPPAPPTPTPPPTPAPPAGTVSDVVHRLKTETGYRAEPVRAAAPRTEPARAAAPRTERPAAEAPILMGSLAQKDGRSGRTAAPAAGKPDSAGDGSIDKHYAEHHGQWVCRYCETMNDDSLGLCQACGSPRS